MKIIIAITGASGAIYARVLTRKLLQYAADKVQLSLIVTKNGEQVVKFEDDDSWFYDSRIKRYDNDDLFSPMASGSSDYEAMVIVPCSMGTLSSIATGGADDLISRSADVMLKERRKLIIVARETPVNIIHLENMLAISRCGGIIMPASPSFYSKPETIGQLCESIADRIISLLGIYIPHYEWSGK